MDKAEHLRHPFWLEFEDVAKCVIGPLHPLTPHIPWSLQSIGNSSRESQSRANSQRTPPDSAIIIANIIIEHGVIVNVAVMRCRNAEEYRENISRVNACKDCRESTRERESERSYSRDKRREHSGRTAIENCPSHRQYFRINSGKNALPPLDFSAGSVAETSVCCLRREHCVSVCVCEREWWEKDRNEMNRIQLAHNESERDCERQRRSTHSIEGTREKTVEECVTASGCEREGKVDEDWAQALGHRLASIRHCSLCCTSFFLFSWHGSLISFATCWCALRSPISVRAMG